MSILKTLKQHKGISSEATKELVEKTMSDLNACYKNKSSDEYKCKGDITKSPNYESIEYSVAQLSTIQKYPEADAKALKDLFNSLHRPRFAKMIAEYMHKPTDENTIFALVFTVFYRLLVGELSRIYTSTEATDKGFVYSSSKIGRDESLMPLIKRYSKDLEKEIDKLIVQANKHVTPIQEASILESLGDGANIVVGFVEGFFNVISNIFSSAKALNPVALISACLSRSYDKKVEKFSQISAEYEAAKKAYEDYKKLPPAKRKERIEHKYVKMIDKYNIQMKTLQATIAHYDKNSKDEVEEVSKSKSTVTTSTVDTSPASSNNGNDDSNNGSDFDF